MRSAPLAIASIVATLALPSGALSGAVARQAVAARTVTPAPAMLRFGRSIGSPTDGRLVGGMHLDERPYLRVVPVYSAGDARWGLEPLVTMIERAARAVHRQFPETIAAVGHLSRAGGGDLDRHRSHESGRDADLGFFVRGGKGKQLFASHFVPFRGDGTAASWPGAYFDDARNWALVAAMVSDAEAHVTHVFVASPLRARLLGYAERVGAPAALRVRAAEVMQQPRGTLPHDDHFHVRIGCPAHMSGCVENPAVRAAIAARPAPVVQAHGRRGGEASDEHALPALPAAGRDARSAGAPPATAGRSTGATSAPGSTPAVVPLAPLAPANPPGTKPPRDDAPREPEIPPASLSAPLDDVDG